MTWTQQASVAALVAGIATLVALGCKRDAEEPASAVIPVDPPPAAAPVSAGAASRVEEESFTLTLRGKGPYAAGKPSAFEVVLDAKGGYKCNDKYPYKWKAQQSPDIDYASPVVTGDALSLEKNRAVMTVAFTPKTAGGKTVAGQFSFSVCTEERCLVERRDLALKIDVQ